MPSRKPDNWTPQSTQSRVDSIWAGLKSRREGNGSAEAVEDDER